MKEIIRNIVENNYDLGTVKTVEPIPIGAINQSYAALVEKEGQVMRWFIRFYAIDKEASEISYELGLMFHLRRKEFAGNCCPLLTKTGGAFVTETIDGQERYFSVHEWLSGDEPYSWVDNCVPVEACIGVAEMVANLHNFAYDYEPAFDAIVKMPTIDKYLQTSAETLERWVEEIVMDGDKSQFTQYMISRLPAIKNWIDRILGELSQRKNLPQTHIHTDLHPGNFKFDGSRVVGVFDFDWSKKDFRIYEVAFVLTTFATSWFVDNNGTHSLPKMKVILNAYNRAMGNNGCPIGPLNREEWEVLPDMMIACNILMPQESVRQLHKRRYLNGFEYLYYMIHCVNACKWLDEHRREILALHNDNEEWSWELTFPMETKRGGAAETLAARAV